MPGTYTRRAARSAKSGLDLNNKLITVVTRTNETGVNSTPVSVGANKATLYYNSLKKLVNSTNFSSMKDMYKEYRIKQVKIHAYLRSFSSDDALGLKWDANNPINLSYCWERNTLYTRNDPMTADKIDVAPDCVQKVWSVSCT